MSLRRALADALEGREPPFTPLCIYDWVLGVAWEPYRPLPGWHPLIERGLIVVEHARTVRFVEHGVERTAEEERRNGRLYRTEHLKTPVGTLHRVKVDGWDAEFWVKRPEDYRVMQWVVEHTEVEADPESYLRLEEGPDYCFPVVVGSRTPAMTINLDTTGSERFCEDLALQCTELFDLHEAVRQLHRRETELIAKGPGRYVKWVENVTIDMLGPVGYASLLMPVYREAVPVLEAGGKRLMVHYDGRLSLVADRIAGAPFHIVEGLSEPPEGDMHLDECRRAWPEKAFWAGVNLGLFTLPEADLRAEIAAKRERAGKRGLAFELSEDIPVNWERGVPILLDALQELG